MQPDRRHFHRIVFDAPCELHQRDQVWSSTLQDISLKGVLVARPENWTPPEDDSFEVVIHLNDLDSAIVMAVTLRHVEDDRLGFRCQYIDLDSATHLKRLVELNLGDPALLDRELRHLGHEGD
ncbi:PilZ domain-containing protein [Tamilnaduibacter salinus]|uniref:Cyclic diguanosine monophosphate-binding protein n=2 Tax=Tamilnaduibacter salinus TaxID=1484056 RepID=A0A2A2I0C6_9GAMM|nr:PilZ domain-containing protein [Tamilnaduibacter salinus]PAV24595.1 PilZ domain-containing protein [Tamilnaduibacter salinus]